MAESPSSQSAGYSVDLVYPSSFVLGQTPLQMQWAAVAAGATAGPPTRPFSYCDLGCGDGSTLCLLAACYPDASFFGIDVNPAHIELGRDRAERSGVGNVRFVQASFAALETLDLPELDYIVAYGVYSWLPAGLQTSIGDFARKRLRKGGLLALHYSSLPGSAVRDPLNFYLKVLADTAAGGSAERLASGLTALRRLAPVAGFFQRNSEALAILQSIGNAPAAYVAHDTLNRQLHSFYADEIHARLAALGFSYLASAHVLPDYPELMLSAEAFATYRQLTAGADASFREAVRDFVLNGDLRFDLFWQPVEASLPHGQRLHRLGDLYLQRAQAQDDVDMRRRWSAGRAVDLCDPLHSTILDLAAAPSITLDEVLNSAEIKPFARADLELAIEHLFATGLLNVLVRQPMEARYRSDRRYRLSTPLNALKLEESLSSRAAEGLASTVLGSPLLMPPSARLQLLALLGDDVDRLWQPSGLASVMPREQFRQQVRAGLPQFVGDMLPQLLRFGIVEEDRQTSN